MDTMLGNMNAAAPGIARSIKDDGFAIIEECVSGEFIDSACHAIDRAQNQVPVRRRRNQMFAIRNVLEAAPAIRPLIASSVLPALMSDVLGPGAFISRAILFDKTTGANWAVPWHQDTTIAVRRRADAPGFGPWSVKEGVVHVQPPSHILETILTARIHLDDCGAENGALKVIAGSHRRGILNPEQITHCHQTQPSTMCIVRAGGVLLMRPLLLHASSRADQAARRRVLHLEYACAPLPHGLQWNRA